MDEEVNRDENGEADGVNMEVDSKDDIYLNKRSVILKEEMVGGRARAVGRPSTLRRLFVS